MRFTAKRCPECGRWQLWVRGIFIAHCDDISQLFAAVAKVNQREPTYA